VSERASADHGAAALNITAADITAVLLCGGEGRRMGGADKPLLPFRGRPLVEHVLHGLAGSVAQVLLVANRSLDAYRHIASCRLAFEPCTVISDTEPGLGPLAGMAAAAPYLRSPWAFVCAGDVPFVSVELVQRLAAHQTARTDAPRVAHDGERRQPLFALIPRAVMCNAADALQHAASRSVAGWLAAHGAESVPAGDLADQMLSIDEPSQLRHLG
jgi:molybdopterin-guanine dinucleotide biosynthesis protein A